MKKVKTHVAIILDKSGSMASTKDSAIRGFNEQIQQLKEDSKSQEILCSLVTFNGDVFEHLWNVPAEQLTEANPTDFNPSGSTAMLDAVGYTVQKLLDTTNHEDPDTAYLIITISDGETNQDRHHNWSSLKELTQGCEASKKWTFTYIGCSKEYMEQLAQRVGTPVANMASWSNTDSASASAGFGNMKMRQAKYFGERLMGQYAACNYSSSTTGVVADFQSVVQPEEAPTPVIINPADLPKIDVDNLLNNQPKYVKKASPEWKQGDALFANSEKVEWQS